MNSIGIQDQWKIYNLSKVHSNYQKPKIIIPCPIPRYELLFLTWNIQMQVINSI